jgi:hypothetical protein
MADPLHTRAFSVTLAAAPDGGLAAHASLLDVRKVGGAQVRARRRLRASAVGGTPRAHPLNRADERSPGCHPAVTGRG